MNNLSIASPQLPKTFVKTCLIGERYTEEISELSDLGVKCIKLDKSDLLDDEIACHADILAYNLDYKNLLLDKSNINKIEKSECLTDLNYNVIPLHSKSPYPHDISLNVAFIGRHIICKKDYINPMILKFAQQNDIEIIDTKQGYTKCSLCLLNNNAVITEDNGLAYLLKNYQ